MKKISTLFIATTCAAILTSSVFGASIVITPESTTPAAEAITQGVYVNPDSPLPDALTLKSAVSDFKSLSKADKRSRIKDVKAAFKEYKKEKKEGKAEAGTNTLLEIILTILIPPVGVLVHEGKINNKFWIDLILTLLFYVPGLIYGLIVVLG